MCVHWCVYNDSECVHVHLQTCSCTEILLLVYIFTICTLKLYIVHRSTNLNNIVLVSPQDLLQGLLGVI